MEEREGIERETMKRISTFREIWTESQSTAVTVGVGGATDCEVLSSLVLSAIIAFRRGFSTPRYNEALDV